MDILGQSALLVGLTSFAFGFSVLARNVRNKLFIAFAGACSLITLWALSFFLDKIWSDLGFYRLHLTFNVWLAPVALLFIRVMVRIQDAFSRRLLEFSLLLALSLSVSILFEYDFFIPWVRQAIYFAPTLVVIQILHLMWIDRRLRRGIKRLPKLPTVGFGRRNLIYFGGLLVLLTSVMDHVPAAGLGIPSFGNLALTVYLFFLSQAISQQRLLNFPALLSRFLVLIAVALTLTGVYSILVAWIQNSPGLFFLNSFIASFLILMLLDPLRTMVGSLTQRLLTMQHRRLQDTLKDAQRKLTGIVDVGSLFQAILQTVEQTLQPERATLFVLRSDWTKYRRVRSIGQETPSSSAPRELLANHTLLQYCLSLYQKGDLPILLDQVLENEIDRSASKEQRAYLFSLIQGLKALESNLLIPLFDSGQILGFVALYVPAPPEPWGSNWGLLSVLFPYFEQAAQTLQSMEVFVRQREKERLATIGEMAAGLAHEIRNPLGAIKGAAQFLDPSADRPESRFLRVIVEEVDRLNRVVTQFLDYSKPNPTDFRPVDVSFLTEKTLEVLKPSVDSGVQIEFVPSRIEARALAAPEQIQQVILNLVQNSLKMLSGRPDPRLRVSVDAEGENRSQDIVITVEDNGPGIKREHLDKIFIPFFTTSPSGTGLGLSICQKIIEAHRGRIEVVSEEGSFAKFSVILPLISNQLKS